MHVPRAPRRLRETMLNETVRRAFLVCVLATRVIVPSSAYASSGYSYSLSYSIEYPDCGGDISSIADGLCQFENNNEVCSAIVIISKC